MEFSKYSWQLYRESPEGKKAIARDLGAHAAAVNAEEPFDYAVWLTPLQSNRPAGRTTRAVIDLRESIAATVESKSITCLDDAEMLFTSIVDGGVTWRGENEEGEFELLYGGGRAREHDSGFADVYCSIDGLTSGLFGCFPEFFFPYFFTHRFDDLQKICNQYDIPVPEVPGKLQKRERALYYLSINRAMQTFRQDADLSPEELNAFLYDFAPKDLANKKEEPLPRPSRIWFIMGGIGNNGDFEYLDNVTDSSVTHWQGNLETRRGDIVLIWCVSPRSSMHSVWRATADGFNDPYFFYYSTIRVGRPIKIPPITFAELKSHPRFAEHPAIRAHFQGRSGMAFTIEEYGAICEMVKEKGFAPTLLPPPPEELPLPDVKLSNERDVEIQLVEPFLKRLGYAESDWRYQFRVRMGRGERYVPDYVLGAIDKRGEDSGVAIIESKFDISSSRERQEAFEQGRSYALRLDARVMAVAARQGIWVYHWTDHGYDKDQFLFKTWRELNQPDKLAEVDRLLGKRAVEAELAARQKKIKSTSHPPHG